MWISSSVLWRTSQPSSLIGTCLTLPNLGFLWVFFKFPKISKNGNRLFFPVKQQYPDDILSIFKAVVSIITMFKEWWWLLENVFQTLSLSRLSHKVFHLLYFAVLFGKFTNNKTDKGVCLWNTKIRIFLFFSFVWKSHYCRHDQVL